MKIISKFKDYYDHLAGIYGVDDKLILDRREFVSLPDFTSDQSIKLFICDYVLEGMFKLNKFYWGEQLRDIAVDVDSFKNKWQLESWSKYKGHPYVVWIREVNDDINRRFIHVSKYRYSPMFTQLYKDDNKTNTVNNCPILLKDNLIKDKLIKYPPLKSFPGIQTVLPPHRIYLMLSEWLSSKLNVNPPNNQKDKEKIVSHGFDIKSSFRNIK